MKRNVLPGNTDDISLQEQNWERAQRFGDGLAVGAVTSKVGSLIPEPVLQALVLDRSFFVLNHGFCTAQRSRVRYIPSWDEAGSTVESENSHLYSQAVRGTCWEVEKSYYRLTSKPDPSTVRPEPVLQQALSRLVRSASPLTRIAFLRDASQSAVLKIRCAAGAVAEEKEGELLLCSRSIQGHAAGLHGPASEEQSFCEHLRSTCEGGTRERRLGRVQSVPKSAAPALQHKHRGLPGGVCGVQNPVPGSTWQGEPCDTVNLPSKPFSRGEWCSTTTMCVQMDGDTWPAEDSMRHVVCCRTHDIRQSVMPYR